MIHKEVISLGTGGQGVVLLGRLIGMAATNAGFFSTQKASYSSAVRGDLPVSSDVIISERPVRFPFLSKADIFIAMNGAGIDKYAPFLNQLEVFLYDPTTVSTTISPKPVSVPAAETARDLGVPVVANTVMLGAFSQFASFIPSEIFVETLKQNLPERHWEVNLKAFEAGQRAVQV